MKLSQNGFIISCSTHVIPKKEAKKMKKMIFDLENWLENQILGIFVNSWSSEHNFNYKNN